MGIIIDALDALQAQGVDFGWITTDAVTDALLDDLGDWLAVGDRRWLHVTSVQSNNAGLITAGKPSALESLELLTVAMHAHSDPVQAQAQSAAAKWSAVRLSNGPLGMKVTLGGLSLPSFDQTERTDAYDNDVCVLRPFGAGASANQRVLHQEDSYGGGSFTVAVTLVYTLRRCMAAVQPVLLRLANQGRPLKTGPEGEALIASALTPVLDSIAAAGHYTPYTLDPDTDDEISMPEGYHLRVYSEGSNIYADITFASNQEARKLHMSFVAVTV